MGLYVANHDAGRNRDVRVPVLEEELLHRIEETPSTSTRVISRDLQVSHMTVWRVLREQLLCPYHIQRVQALLPTDFEPRIRFCQWFLDTCIENPEFTSVVLFTDEAKFSREAITNFHNNHIWTDANPHAITERRHQQTFSLNVWVGIIGDRLLGPVFLPNILNGDNYLNFLRDDLPELLEDLPLDIRQLLYFMHDGAPAHYRVTVREFLNETFSNRWIGRGGPVSWPARPPDCNPCDFYLWGHVKSLVYD